MMNTLWRQTKEEKKVVSSQENNLDVDYKILKPGINLKIQ